MSALRATSKPLAAWLGLLGLLLGGGACSRKRRASEAGAKGSAADPWVAAAAAADAGGAAPAAHQATWHRESAALEFDCDDRVPPGASYAAALAAGRKEGTAKRWADAVAAFRDALLKRDDDPAALNELAWALLQVGEAQEARTLAERAAAATTEPKAKAAGLYNAGRAAEAVGDLAGAKAHYEASLALRESEPVRARVAKLAPPPVRSVPRRDLLKTCQELPSVNEVCTCLAASSEVVRVSGPGSEASCQLSEARTSGGEPKAKSDRGALVSVWSRSSDRDTMDPGHDVVLVARRGATWSALRVVESADEVDRTETPMAREQAEVRSYEELSFGGGTLFWVQTEQVSRDQAAGPFVQGKASLTLCAVPADGDAGKAPWCAQLSLGEWDYDSEPEGDDDRRRCAIRKLQQYKVRLDSSGEGAVILERGVDEEGAVGRFRL
ncbi:MAG: hypothetical protein R3B48_06790 [Kofleriaceae bacterium]